MEFFLFSVSLNLEIPDVQSRRHLRGGGEKKLDGRHHKATRQPVLAPRGGGRNARAPPRGLAVLGRSRHGEVGVGNPGPGSGPAHDPDPGHGLFHARVRAHVPGPGHGRHAYHALGRYPMRAGQTVSFRPCLTYDSSSHARQLPCGGLLRTHLAPGCDSCEKGAHDHYGEICLLGLSLGTYHDLEIALVASDDPYLPPPDPELGGALFQMRRGGLLPMSRP